MFKYTFLYLTLCPLVVALACLVLPGKKLRAALVSVTGTGLIIASVTMALTAPATSVPAFLSNPAFTSAIQFADFCLLGLICFFGIKYRNRTITGLSLAQIALLAYFETAVLVPHAPAGLYCDTLSLIMVLLISVAGSLIVFYALPYMRRHEHHLGLEKSRQPRFFALLFLFIGSMNALVLVNDLMLFYFCFEITTLCSFLLIGHDKTEEAGENAVTALWINSLGGAALLGGIVMIYSSIHTLDIQAVLAAAPYGKAMMIPLGLLCIAGFSKAAQMPFQKWLLGAMVAPTPTSALLHSATMVKAGVYLVIRFAPAFEGTALSTGVAICGAFTFLSAAALAIGQRNGKRVLAYSTISNLGLILACAGINTHAAITAAILLVIFHAVSKALLFLCMGTVEQHIGSRDIEDMRGLFGEMPRTAIILTMGILTMILPPFGMLLGKWMAIESASGNLAVTLMLAMGSALTVVYWARWAGILMGSEFRGPSRPETQSFFTRMPLTVLLVSALALSLGAPLIYSMMIPADYAGTDAFSIAGGIFSNTTGSFIVMPLFLMAGAVFMFALYRTRNGQEGKTAAPYMSGISGEKTGTYIGPMNRTTDIVQSNYYLSAFFGEDKLCRIVNYTAGILILIMIGVSL